MDERAQAATAAVSPTRTISLLRRVFRPIMLRVGIAAVLEVPSRRTGTPLQVTLIPWEVDGTWYLLSLYGISDWVRNLRAAGRCELRRKGRTEAFTAIEVDGDERDRVIAAFRARSGKPFNRDFDQLPGAADHPAFRLEPIG
ncbi:MAG TPA: nitroreductase/quinone reductase family protein [Candidatus Limnocylindrales bacterium]|nr:nitroreductase/quinone reductase family protein [Candidatus Limnocylindrales bacterium]